MDQKVNDVSLRSSFAVFFGNGLEFYDFLTFSYFAVYIGATFFPSQDATVSLLAALATFGAGFLTRPLGAIVIGRMGDRIGRKPAMLFAFSLMGFSLLGFALTPSYRQIGVAAPVLAVVFRLVQGFALGGDIGPTTAFMAEAAPPDRRGIYLSMQYVTQDAATLCAGIVGVALAAGLTASQLQDWGWRLALLFGVSILPFALAMRRRLPETLPPQAKGPELLKPHKRIIVLGLIMIAAATVGAYSIGYMTTYALTVLHLPATTAFGVTIVSGIVSILCEVSSGWLCDRIGRRAVMLIFGTGLVFSILPCFWLITHFPSLWILYGAETVMVILGATSAVPIIVAVAESLPRAIRSGAFATIYAVAVAISGGSTQLVEAWLVRVTGNALMPAWYWTAAALAGLIAMSLTSESHPTRSMAPGRTPR